MQRCVENYKIVRTLYDGSSTVASKICTVHVHQTCPQHGLLNKWLWSVRAHAALCVTLCHATGCTHTGGHDADVLLLVNQVLIAGDIQETSNIAYMISQYRLAYVSSL